MTLGQMLREARQKKGWSVVEAQAMLGVNNLSRLETGDLTNPTLGTLARFVRVYGISAAALIRTAKTETAPVDRSRRRGV